MNTTAVTVIERAAVALGSSKAETELTALAAKSKDITAITNPAGREECHAAAMVAKNARISVKKVGESARDDANAYVNAVIAEQKRLIGLIEPEEKRLIALRDEWDEKIAAEKAAKAEEERLALAAIKARIDKIKAWPVDCATASPESILDEIRQLEKLEIDDSFGASYGEAVEAKAVSLAKLREIHAAKVAAEVEAARVREELAAQAERNRIERIELDRQRAEQQQRDAAEQAERAAEAQRLADARAEIAAAQLVLDEAKDEAQRQADAAAREAQAKETARIAAQAAADQKVIDDAAAEEKRAADAVAAQQLHELAQKQATQQAAEYAEQQKAASVPAIAVEQTGRGAPPWISDLHEIAHRLNDNEGARLVHYARRLIQERQSAA